MSQPEKFLLTKHIKHTHTTYDVSDVYARGLFEGRTRPLIAHLPLHCAEGKFASTLTDQPRLKYKSQKNKWKWPMHWGTLKMFLAEFRFLTMATRLIRDKFACICLSMHGLPHQKLLENIFHVTILHASTLEQCVAECDECTKKGVPYVLYNDLRTGCSEKSVREDMHAQLKLWQQLNPLLTSMKFRLEYTNGRDDVAVTYPSGDIHLLPYTGPTSTESQLIVRRDAPMKKYSSITYEEQMFYHNTVARNMSYDVIGKLSLVDDCLCNCYDCGLFAHIIREYLFSIKNVDASAIIVKSIAKMLSSNITPGKTMLSQTVANINRNWTFMFFRSYAMCDSKSCKHCVYGKNVIASNELYE